MTQTEWENEMCIKILELIQNELYVDFRYLDVAVSALTLTPNDSLRSTATDGISFFFPPEQILRVFRSNPLFFSKESIIHSTAMSQERFHKSGSRLTRIHRCRKIQ